MFDGLSEKNRTAAKNAALKISLHNAVCDSPTIGFIPTVKEVAAQRGIAKKGPIVR